MDMMPGVRPSPAWSLALDTADAAYPASPIWDPCGAAPPAAPQPCYTPDASPPQSGLARFHAHHLYMRSAFSSTQLDPERLALHPAERIGL